MVPLRINPIYTQKYTLYIDIYIYWVFIGYIPYDPRMACPSLPPFRLVDDGKVHHQLLIAGHTRSWQLPPRPWEETTAAVFSDGFIWVFPKIGVPQNGWLFMENPIKMDDLGGTIIFGNTNMGLLLSYFRSWVPCNSTKVTPLCGTLLQRDCGCCQQRGFCTSHLGQKLRLPWIQPKSESPACVQHMLLQSSEALPPLLTLLRKKKRRGQGLPGIVDKQNPAKGCRLLIPSHHL